MKLIHPVTLMFVASASHAESVDFRDASHWRLVCTAEQSIPDDAARLGTSMTVLWDRRGGAAEIVSDDGRRKFLRQLTNDADYAASFWFGPETSSVTPSGQSHAIDCCYNSMLSIRRTGEYALSSHDILSGGLTVSGHSGTCEISPIEVLYSE